MRHWAGGGHPAAAAASFRLQGKGEEAVAEALAVLGEAHGIVLSQVPKQVKAILLHIAQASHYTLHMQYTTGYISRSLYTT
jgi:hypothetical protein